MKRIRPWYAMIGWLALALTGCAPTPPTIAERGYPPDFSLVFTVEHDAEPVDVDEPLHRPAQHVVLPDRTFRAALGEGAGHDYHPQITARLTPEQMFELYQFVEAGHLLEMPEGPFEPTPDGVRYELAITAHGYRRQYITTPTARPAATMLLRELVALREGRRDR